MENEYEIKTGIELDGKFYELTQKYKEISAEKYHSLYCILEQSDDSNKDDDENKRLWRYIKILEEENKMLKHLYDDCCICLAKSEGELDEYKKEIKH